MEHSEDSGRQLFVRQNRQIMLKASHWRHRKVYTTETILGGGKGERKKYIGSELCGGDKVKIKYVLV